MQMLKSAYAKNDLIQFVSMTINPRYDTPKVLDIYADSLSATPDKWNLLTADSAKQYQFINEELLLDAHQGYTDTGIARYAYANYFILVDPQHRIRGFYEAYNQETISKLDDEIKVLIAEVLRNTKDGR